MMGASLYPLNAYACITYGVIGRRIWPVAERVQWQSHLPFKKHAPGRYPTRENNDNTEHTTAMKYTRPLVHCVRITTLCAIYMAHTTMAQAVEHKGRYAQHTPHHGHHHAEPTAHISNTGTINAEGICRSAISHAITNWGSDITQLKLYTAPDGDDAYVFRIDNTQEPNPWAKPVGHGTCAVGPNDTGDTVVQNLEISTLSDPREECGRAHQITPDSLSPIYDTRHILTAFALNGQPLCNVQATDDGAYTLEH